MGTLWLRHSTIPNGWALPSRGCRYNHMTLHLNAEARVDRQRVQLKADMEWHNACESEEP